MKKIQKPTKQKQSPGEWALLALTVLFLCALFVLGQSPAVEVRPVPPDAALLPERNPPEDPEAPSDPETEGAEEPEILDLNAAWSVDLEKLPGIGPVLAGRIMEYRREHGPFTSPEELLEVPGIGAGTYAAIRDRITVGGGAP